MEDVLVNYIVDPMWFYWLQVFNELRILFMSAGLIGCGVGLLGAAYVTL